MRKILAAAIAQSFAWLVLLPKTLALQTVPATVRPAPLPKRGRANCCGGALRGAARHYMGGERAFSTLSELVEPLATRMTVPEVAPRGSAD